jgi:hypothetical protein
VAGRAYFPRPNHEYQGVASVQNGHKQPLWNVHPQVSMPEPLVSGPSMSFTKNILRRHSFSEKGNMDSNPSSNVPNSAIMGGSPKHSTRPPRFESSQSLGPQNLHQDILHMPHRHVGVPIMSSARPYTFDPLFIEDPLSAGNNVGRNAFRIFQVQVNFDETLCFVFQLHLSTLTGPLLCIFSIACVCRCTSCPGCEFGVGHGL